MSVATIQDEGGVVFGLPLEEVENARQTASFTGVVVGSWQQLILQIVGVQDGVGDRFRGLRAGEMTQDESEDEKRTAHRTSNPPKG